MRNKTEPARAGASMSRVHGFDGAGLQGLAAAADRTRQD